MQRFRLSSRPCRWTNRPGPRRPCVPYPVIVSQPVVTRRDDRRKDPPSGWNQASSGAPPFHVNDTFSNSKPASDRDRARRCRRRRQVSGTDRRVPHGGDRRRSVGGSVRVDCFCHAEGEHRIVQSGKIRIRRSDPRPATRDHLRLSRSGRLFISAQRPIFGKGSCRVERRGTVECGPAAFFFANGKMGTFAPKTVYEPSFFFLSIKTACCHRLGALSVR